MKTISRLIACSLLFALPLIVSADLREGLVSDWPLDQPGWDETGCGFQR